MNIWLPYSAGPAGVILACGVAILAAGCGSMQQTRVDDWAAEPSSSLPDDQRLSVIVGNVTATMDQPAEVRESVCRYLRDVTKAEISQRGAFHLVDTNAAAAFDVEVTRLEETLGATVKVGLVSSQQKHAVAKVKITLRSLIGGDNLTSLREGRSSKGAWGVITSVNREVMRGGQDEWTLDGSMIGVACADAVRAGIEDLETQTLVRAKAFDAGIERRPLQPRTEWRWLQERTG